MEKKEVRQKILEQRRSLLPSQKEVLDRVICEKIIHLQPYLQAKIIMTYASFDGEVDTFGLIDRMIKDDKKVCVPRVREQIKHMNAVRISSVLDLDTPISSSAKKIPEPTSRCRDIFDPNDIDLVLVPLVAFDEEGGRIGYGGGYFDRFLAKIVPERIIGLAYEFQAVETFSKESHDILIPMIVTESRIQILS